jgi:hypothetical protein
MLFGSMRAISGLCATLYAVLFILSAELLLAAAAVLGFKVFCRRAAVRHCRTGKLVPPRVLVIESVETA